jgi:hypothetical protein
MKLHKCVSLMIVAIALTVGVSTSSAQVPQGMTEQQLRDLLSSIDQHTDRFAKSADSALDKSGFDGTPREDELNSHLQSFRGSSKVLRNNYQDAKALGYVENVLRHGVAINNFLKRNPLEGVESDWTTLRSDLEQLANAYGVKLDDERFATGARVGEADIKNLLQHIEDAADKYKLTLDAAMDNSALNNTSAEDDINAINANFRKATRHLEDSRNNDNAPQAAKEVLVRGKRIDAFLTKHSAKLTPEVASSWLAVRTDLERLARLYSIKWQW